MSFLITRLRGDSWHTAHAQQLTCKYTDINKPSSHTTTYQPATYLLFPFLYHVFMLEMSHGNIACLKAFTLKCRKIPGQSLNNMAVCVHYLHFALCLHPIYNLLYWIHCKAGQFCIRFRLSRCDTLARQEATFS
ncbi:hypothetical protein XELAEV_18034444mg [Xenopus laevis]|uniref:Uncharacterized protein n=1 Tax=Xenopus laevis TaxID=8355 RepID=A0A974HB93_XENLA|nr:hypothetical protein XELAEV_18034444mg [Xenopus laevis]